MTLAVFAEHLKILSKGSILSVQFFAESFRKRERKYLVSLGQSAGQKYWGWTEGGKRGKSLLSQLFLQPS